MISDITLGQFFPGNSAIHRLDPRTKLILTVLLIVAIFMASNPISLFIVTLVTILTVAASRTSFKVILRAIKPIIVILLFTAVLNLLMTKGESTPLFSWWIINIYKEGIIRAAFMAFRVVVLIVGTSVLLTYTTSPISLTDGIEALLKPLRYIGVPVHIFAMMMTIALRFIPTLIEETEKIMNAQKSRGADFTSGSLVKRAKALIPILIPLFVSSFKRAEELATAMECRCYRGDVNRTKLVKLTFKTVDLRYFIYGAVFMASVVFFTFFSSTITLPDVDWLKRAYEILTYRLQ